MKTITVKDFEKIVAKAKEAENGIAKGHCRIRQEEYHNTIIKEVQKAKSRKETDKPVAIIVRGSFNQGTRKYSHYIRTAEYVVLKGDEKETEKMLGGYRKSNILAFVK